MKKTCLTIMALMLLFFFKADCFAFFEGFEDGDITNNPVWVNSNPQIGSHSIIEDPFRTNNKVLSVVGTSSANRAFSTNVNIPVNGFYLEVEYAASSAIEYDMILSLQGQNSSILKTRLIISDNPDSARWITAENPSKGSEWLLQDPTAPYIPFHPAGEWWKIILWNQSSTELVHGEIRRVSDNSLIWTRTVNLPSITNNEYINQVGLSISGIYSQYVDNLSITPEPCTLSILAIGGLALLRKRK